MSIRKVLRSAMTSDNATALSSLIKESEIESVDANGNTLLHLSAERGKESCIRVLLEKNANIHSKNNEGYTPLQCAVIDGHISCVRTLIDNQADVNSQNEFGMTPLLAAAWNNQVEIADILLHMKANTNHSNSFGWTPLMYASMHCKDGEMTKTLLQPGMGSRSTIYYENDSGDTALKLAVDHNNTAAYEFLAAAINDNEQANTPSLTSSSSSSKRATKKRSRAEMESEDENGEAKAVSVADVQERRMMMEQVHQGKNPYLEYFRQTTQALGSDLERVFDPSLDTKRRDELVAHLSLPYVLKFGWAVPDERAIKIIAEVCKDHGVIEIGCGQGYWGAMLRKAGVDYVGVDETLYDLPWTDVQQGGPETLADECHANRNLLLCYPDDYETSPVSLALECLEHFKGDIIVLCGETLGNTVSQNPWGRTADFDFQLELHAQFHMLLQVPLPSWSTSKDTLTVWARTIVTHVNDDIGPMKCIAKEEQIELAVSCPKLQHLL